LRHGQADGQQPRIGANIVKLLNVVHPAVIRLAIVHPAVKISNSQDDDVRDGTTSIVILAGDFLKQWNQFVEEGVHHQLMAEFEVLDR
jgi:T-complex protein 1 subunit eta